MSRSASSSAPSRAAVRRCHGGRVVYSLARPPMGLGEQSCPVQITRPNLRPVSMGRRSRGAVVPGATTPSAEGASRETSAEYSSARRVLPRGEAPRQGCSGRMPKPDCRPRKTIDNASNSSIARSRGDCHTRCRPWASIFVPWGDCSVGQHRRDLPEPDVFLGASAGFPFRADVRGPRGALSHGPSPASTPAWLARRYVSVNELRNHGRRPRRRNARRDKSHA